MSQTVSMRLSGFLKFLRIAAALTFVLAVACLVTPTVSKRLRLEALGEQTMSETAAFSMALSHFASSDLERLSSQPKADTFSKELSALLSKVSERNGYAGTLLLARAGDKGYAVLADSKFREGGVAGTDYYAAGAAYPPSVYKYASKRLENIYAGKSAAGYVPGLVTARNEKAVLSVYVPIYGQGSAVLAVLAIDVIPQNTHYNMLGPVDLYYTGGFFLLLFVLSMLTLVATKKFFVKQPQSVVLLQRQEELVEPPVESAPPTPEEGEPTDGAE